MSPRILTVQSRTAPRTLQSRAKTTDHRAHCGWPCFIEDEGVLSVYTATGWSPGVTV
jgi:hypothetical protein